MSGGWVPIPKALVKELPHTREFSKLEAFFSMAVDYDREAAVTILGYAKLWRWSRGKVERFMRDVGVTIAYPRETKDVQRQRGKLAIQRAETEQEADTKRAEDRCVKLIDSKWLSGAASRKQAEGGQKTSRRRRTTENPKPKPKKTFTARDGMEYSEEECFNLIWDRYPRPDGKKDALRYFQQSVNTNKDMGSIMAALNNYLKYLDDNKIEDQYIKSGKNFLANWTDWVPEADPNELGGSI